MTRGETIESGAPATCSECKVTPEYKVYQSPGGAGFYIGTYCDCGPYSRESDYFKTRDLAENALVHWQSGNKIGIRT